jgi:RNase P subunit RPR2
MNYERDGLFGEKELAQDELDWFRDNDHIKQSVRKAIKFLRKEYSYCNCAHFLVDGTNWAVYFENHEDYEQDLLTVKKSCDWNSDVPYKIDAATLQRQLVKLANDAEVA